jgi:hypothetical protein
MWTGPVGPASATDPITAAASTEPARKIVVLASVFIRFS